MAEIFAQPVFALLVVLAVLVMVHELGHYLVGRAFGIGVEIFSIGFGPKLWSITRNGTEYQIAWLPLGGFVKFAGAYAGDPVPEHFRGKEMYQASALARALTAAAGPAANLLLAIAIFTGFGFKGISHIPAEVGYVLAESPAEKGGLRSGDKVLSVNGLKITTWEELRGQIIASPEQSLSFNVDRAGKQLSLNLSPKTQDGESDIGLTEKQGRLGINPAYVPATITPLVASASTGAGALPFGAEVTEVSFAEEIYPVGSWSEMLRYFAQAYEKRALNLTLTFHTTQDGKAQPSEKTTIDLEAWYQNVEGFASTTLLGQEALAKAIGLANSQLTVLAADEGAKDHLLPNDRLLTIEGKKLDSIYDLVNFLQSNEQPEVNIQVMRRVDGKPSLVMEKIALTPQDIQKVDGKKTVYTLSIKVLGQERLPDPYIERYTNPLSAFMFGCRYTFDFAAKIAKAIVGLFTGQVPLKALGGPIIIAKVAGDAAELGLEAFLKSIALISINLGLINLVPIPALDGGQIMLVLTEVAFRRRLSNAAIENYQRLGFVFLLSLVVIAMYNDLSRFWSSMLRSVSSFF